jgi:hypothetical protein
MAVVLSVAMPESLVVSPGVPGPAAEFLAKYWWALLATPAIVLTAFFLGHAVANANRPGVQRFIWAAGILLLGPIVVPAYWWVCSDAT